MECPQCGHRIPTGPKQRKGRPCLNADTSTMSDADMRAYYKATAPAGDAAFFANAIRNCKDRQLIVAAESLALQAASGEYGRREVYARLTRLQAIWRSLDYRDGLSIVHNAAA